MLKKMLKRLIILSAVVITLVMCTSAAYAEDTVIRCYDGIECTHGEGCQSCYYEFDTSTGYVFGVSGQYNVTSITIPESVSGLKVVGIGGEAFLNFVYLENVTLPNTIEIICNRAFMYCYSLEEIDIPGSVKEICDSAFSNTGIKKVGFSEGLEAIGDAAFLGHNIETITIPNSLRYIGQDAFWGNTVADYINLQQSTVDSESLLECDKGFLAEESNIKYRVINGILYDKNIGTLISCPKSKKSVIIPSTVEKIDRNAFQRCEKIINIQLNDGLETIANSAFYGCSMLSEIIIPSSVKEIEADAFGDCINLKHVSLPNNIKVGFRAFDGSSIESLEIPSGFQSCPGAYGENPGAQFIRCENLKKITFKCDISEEMELTSQMFCECTSLTDVIIPEGVSTISDGAFLNCTNLKSIQLPESLEIIGDNVFYGCPNLTIKGVRGSAAERYANAHDIPFMEIGAADIIVPPQSYLIVVVDSKGKPIEGAHVDFDTQSDITNSKGIASFDRWTIEQPLIEVTCSGYVTYSNRNTNYTKSPDGYDIVRLYKPTEQKLLLKSAIYSHKDLETEEDTRGVDLCISTKRLNLSNPNGEFTIKCDTIGDDIIIRYEIWQGKNKIASTYDGVFHLTVGQFKAGKGIEIRAYDSAQNYVITPINLEIVKSSSYEDTKFELGETLSFTIGDDIPILGGLTIKIDTLNQTPVKCKISDDTLYVGINIKDFEEKSIKQLKEQGNLLKKISKYDLKSDKEKLEELLKKNFKSGFDKKKPVQIEIMGYGEAKLSDDIITDAKVTIYLGISIKVKIGYNWQTIIFAVPVTGSIEGSLDISTSNEVVFDFETSTLKGNVAVNVNPKLSGYIGAGAGKLLSGGGYADVEGDSEFIIIGTEKTGFSYIDASIEAGLKFYLGNTELPYPLAKKTWHLYTRPTTFALRSLMAEAGGKRDVDIYDAGNYKRQNIDYMENQSQWLGETLQNSGMSLFSMRSIEKNTIHNLLENTYENSQPVIASNSEKMVMAYLTADTSRNANNFTRVMYSVYDEITGTWKEPASIDSDGTADYAPRLYSDGTDIYIIYQKGTTEFSDDAEVTLEELIMDQSIVIAKFDNESETFADHHVLAANSEEFLSSGRLGFVNGVPTAVWVANSNTEDIFMQNSENEIWQSQCVDGVWTDAENVISGENCITDIAVTDTGITYIADDDNDLRTYDGRTLYLFIEDTTFIMDYGELSNIFIPADSNGEIALYYTQNGMLKVGYSDGVVDTATENISISDRYFVNGNKLYFTQSSAQKTIDIYRADYNPEYMEWTEPVKVTTNADGKLIENFTATEYKGETFGVFANSSISTSDSSVSRVSDMAWCKLEGVTDITLTKTIMNNDFAAPNQIAPAYLWIKNNGTEPVNGIQITVTDEKGDIVAYEEKDITIEPGQEVSVYTDLQMPKKIVPAEYTFYVETAELDVNYNDNSTTVKVGMPELSLSSELVQIADTIYLYMTVKNEGYVSSSARLNAYCGDKEVMHIEIPELRSGEDSEGVLYVVNMSEAMLTDGKSDTLEFVLTADDDEYNLSDNIQTVYLNLDYLISYDANGGTGEIPPTSKTYDVTAFVSETLPTKDGFRCIGWSTKDDAATAEYRPGDAIETNRDVVLYAVWRDATSFIGDVNEDGVIDIFDMQRLYEHLNGSNPLVDELLTGDVNQDGVVDIFDMQRLYEHLNGSNPL